VRGCVGFALLALLLLPRLAHAQYQSPSEKLLVTAHSASTRPDGDGSIVEADGNVTIQLDRAKLSADAAVIWLPGDVGPNQLQKAHIALIGHASVEQKGVNRSGDELFVTADVSGTIRLTAQLHDAPATPSDLFAKAQALRDLTEVAANAPVNPPAVGPVTAPFSEPVTQPVSSTAPSPGAMPPVAGGGGGGIPVTQPSEIASNNENPSTPASHPTTRPKARPTTGPVEFSAGQIETAETPRNRAAIVLTDGVMIFQQREKGDIVELRSQRAVLFTTAEHVKELAAKGRGRHVQDDVESAYLEGDVRIVYTSAGYFKGEQRLTADRVYYEFATDRAILTNAIVHTVDIKRQVPVIIRAKILRQVAEGEYKGEKGEFTTSSFALPTVAIAADRLYAKTETQSDGTQETYVKANSVTLPVFGVPVFYWPVVSGNADNQAGAMRDIGIQNRNNFGFGPNSEWGLFETLGMTQPKDLDAAYRLDYYSERGPGLGLSAAYQGGNITDTTTQPEAFNGDFKAYFVEDKGTDDLNRGPIKDGSGERARGRLLWQHTQYFPDGWEAQLRAGYVSDATFLEQWYRQDYETQLPLDVSGYVKHQQETEATTFLLDIQPSRVVTTSDMAQEQFEVERYPEVDYRRIGDGFLDNQLTFFSDNSAAALKFQTSQTSLVDQGYNPKAGINPGIPAEGTTGVFPHTLYRENFRQEVDYPLTAGPIRVVPYTMGILTQYSNSPNGGEITRLLAGAGARFSTSFWKVDSTASSELFDIHQIRHIITPEINLFTSAQNISHDSVYIYDDQIDAVNSISAAQFALRQTWQTKRGAPGEWRNTDFFSLNVEANFFADKPPSKFANPLNFRGLFFPSLPEASVPRNSVNADASWRISDETVLLADMSENLDKGDLATAAIGVLVRRDVRLSYFVENRYVQDLNANITSINLNYNLTNKYDVGIDQSFNFSNGQDVSSGISIARHFDNVTLTVSAYRDLTTNTNSFSVQITPLGVTHGAGAFSNSFAK
jgi:lipopolysaccharide export system protein LptA